MPPFFLFFSSVYLRPNVLFTWQDYGRRDDYQSYEGFHFQDLLQTQEGFPQYHPYTFRGYNVNGGYYDWRGKDVRGDERVEEDGGEQYERVDGDNDEDEGDDVNVFFYFRYLACLDVVLY